MDFENQSERALSKRLSRRTSVGCSSRLSYYRSGDGGVPFIWEKKPGISKEGSPEEVIPPLTPPPALLSLGLPKPCIIHHEPKHSLINARLMRLRFWKKGERIRRRRSNKKPEQECNNEDCCYDEDVGFLDVDYTSDSESMMTSPRGSVLSSYSSFSSSCSSSLSSLVKNNRREREIYGRPFNLGCFPNVRVMVSIARRE
ncbi:hypothetical protein PIB30_069378 [Stylosanthes scabra]|uniref:Uncharacterized protein n=1 Tax=Stylosanthes scabra TaxID=79078 RepID=A0ABU6WLI3_9FABA|nr:hypothetical protein [Stylosanthes scabra]